jgi:predicted Zn-dependent protease
VKRRWIFAVVLLAACGGALALLEWRNASGEITPRPLLYLLADAQRQIERLPLKLTQVKSEEENQIGRELAQHYTGWGAATTGKESQLVGEYLSSVGRRVAESVKRKGIRYEFHYVGDPHLVNAFALPGGQIFFGRGLLALLETEDEFAAILGHEIAHVDERHCIERLQYELKARKLGLRGIYQLGKLAVMIFQAGYTKEKEAEADRAGLALAVAAGYSPAGAVEVERRFARLHPQTQRPAASPVEEIARVPLQSLREYFRSHPPSHERAVRLEKIIAERGWNIRQPQRPLEVRAILATEEAGKKK